MAFLSAFYPQPVVAGTTAGTYAAGNDARLSDARTPTSHAASHAAGTKAQFGGQVAGMTENVIIRANNAGTAGNSITLTFDGVDDIDTVLAAWNAANTSNTAELVSGDGSQVPDNLEEITLSGGVAAGSDPFKNINQNLGTDDAVQFANLNVGNGTMLNLGGNYGQFSSASGSAGFTINRGSTDGYASIDLLQQANPSTGWSLQMQPSSNDLQIVNRAAGPTQLLLPASGTTAIKAEGNIEIADTDNSTKATLVAYTNLTDDRTYDLPDASGTLALTSGATDIEITDATKGLILRSANGIRYRLTIDNDGIPTTTAL